MLQWLLAATHLLGLGVGLGAIWARRDALRGTLDAAGVSRAIRADAWWGIAALLWLVTGVWRAFGGLEKGTDYYLHNHLFLAKMVLFLLIVAIEVVPMRTLARWRGARARGAAVDTAAAAQLARLSTIQAVLIVVMVILATGMARGHGQVP
jgi:putative membrane protein